MRSRKLVDARYNRIREVSRASFLSRSRFYYHPKELSPGKGYSACNAHSTNWHQVPSDTSRRGLILECRVCAVHVAMSEITHNLTFDIAGSSVAEANSNRNVLFVRLQLYRIASSAINYLRNDEDRSRAISSSL